MVVRGLVCGRNKGAWRGPQGPGCAVGEPSREGQAGPHPQAQVEAALPARGRPFRLMVRASADVGARGSGRREDRRQHASGGRWGREEGAASSACGVPSQRLSAGTPQARPSTQALCVVSCFLARVRDFKQRWGGLCHQPTRHCGSRCRTLLVGARPRA